MSAPRAYLGRLSRVGVSIVLVGAALAGCGGGSSGGSATDGGTGASAQFLKPHANASIVRFGHEGSASQLHVVSLVVAKNMAARATAHFARQCETLSVKIIKEVALPQGPNEGPLAACTAALEKDAQPLARTLKVRSDTLEGSINALRVKGNRAYALFHGNDGKDHALPLEKEGDHWKVAALVTTEL